MIAEGDRVFVTLNRLGDPAGERGELRVVSSDLSTFGPVQTVVDDGYIVDLAAGFGRRGAIAKVPMGAFANSLCVFVPIADDGSRGMLPCRRMATFPKPPVPAPKTVPVAPTAEAWQAMSEPARLRLLLEVIDALSDPAIAMSEGRPHKKAKSRAADKLGLYFGSIGKVVYLAEEMAVLYPGEQAFTPDILAVLDVPEPEDDPRMAWVVMDEKKGLDLAIEVLHHGDRKKDLEDNVARYARLGIPEYFVYDQLRQRVVGYRLPASGGGKYQPIIPQFGRYHSQVLGLDLAVEHGQLRIFHGMAELFGSDELIGRLKGMVEDLETRADQAAAQVEQAQAQAEQAQAQVEAAVAGVRSTLLALLEARGLPCTDDVRARVLGCADLPVLERWLLRAVTARSAEEVIAGEG